MTAGICELSGKYYPSLDSHHSIPREFGGESSPQVLLGPDVHQTLHRCVHNVNLRDEFLSSLPPVGRKKAMALIELILQSEVAHRDKPRGSSGEVTVKVTLPTSLYKRLQSIQTEVQAKSVPQVILSILKSVLKA